MRSRWPLLAGVILWFSLGPGGCGVRGTVTLQSVEGQGKLSPTIRSLAYRTADLETADVYLTDLSDQDLDPGASLDEVTGHFIHLHLFLVPRAGHTPIETGASSVTIRYIVLAKGAIGVYGGGGFLLPRGKPGDDTIGGSIRDATMKLIASNSHFRDPLGACSLGASFRAPLDESHARLMAARLDDILAHARAHPPAQGGPAPSTVPGLGSVTPGH